MFQVSGGKTVDGGTLDLGVPTTLSTLAVGANGVIVGTPPEVLVTRVTGAGDTFMAAHIAAEAEGADRTQALARALESAARYVSGDTPL